MIPLNNSMNYHRHPLGARAARTPLAGGWGGCRRTPPPQVRFFADYLKVRGLRTPVLHRMHQTQLCPETAPYSHLRRGVPFEPPRLLDFFSRGPPSPGPGGVDREPPLRVFAGCSSPSEGTGKRRVGVGTEGGRGVGTGPPPARNNLLEDRIRPCGRAIRRTVPGRTFSSECHLRNEYLKPGSFIMNARLDHFQPGDREDFLRKE